MNDMNEPLRLLRQRGHWALEVTKLIPVDRHVLRPERRRVSGAESVVRHLKDRYAPALVREALDLIVGDDDGTDRAFELEGEHWVQLKDDVFHDGQAHAKLLATVSELRAEMTTMRALHEALRERLATLERRSLQGSLVEHPRNAPRGGPRPSPAGASLRPSARQRPSTPAPAAPDPLPLAALAVPATELAEARTQAAVAPPAPPEVTAPPAAALKPSLALPTHADVATCVKQLLGADPELRPEKASLPKDLENFYVARVIDAEERELGAILLDVRGGVELGGRLLGFPPAALEEHAKSDPSADLLDAMNEVANNLGGFINRANPEIRTRVRPLEKLSAAACDWLPQNAGRIGAATKLGGRLWIATR